MRHRGRCGDNRMVREEFYKGKKVFLTGHTGFKGTWLSLMLEKSGAEVYGYALKPETKFYPNANPAIRKNYEGLITDRELLQTALQETEPDFVIHLASHSTLNRSYEITDYIFDTNVMGVVNLLEGVRKTKSVKAVLIVTSDKCYKNLESDEPYEEDSTNGGLGTAVGDVLLEHMEKGKIKFKKFGFPDTFAPVTGSREYLNSLYGLDAESVAESISKVLKE